VTEKLIPRRRVAHVVASTTVQHNAKIEKRYTSEELPQKHVYPQLMSYDDDCN